MYNQEHLTENPAIKFLGGNPYFEAEPRYENSCEKVEMVK